MLLGMCTVQQFDHVQGCATGLLLCHHMRCRPSGVDLRYAVPRAEWGYIYGMLIGWPLLGHCASQQSRPIRSTVPPSYKSLYQYTGGPGPRHLRDSTGMSGRVTG
jgi:hypothetical protein